MSSLKTYALGGAEAPLDFEVKSIELDNPFLKNPHPHRHSFYEIVFVEQGEGFHRIDFVDYPLVQNSVYFLTPGQVHMLDVRGVWGTYVSFTEEFISPFLKGDSLLGSFSYFHNFDNPPLMSLQSNAKVDLVIADMKSLYREEILGKNEMLRANLILLLYLLENDYRKVYQVTEVETLDNVVFKFKRLLDKNFREQRDVTSFAKELSITANHLNELVRKNTGKTAKQWITERVLLEAKRILVQTDKSIYLIAEELNFRDQNYFARFFKKHVGLTPNQFRESQEKC